MELIYAYLGDVGRDFGNVGFNFSPKFICNFIDGILSIRQIPYVGVENYYGNNIANCNLVVGKNGAGKSTLFDLMGKNAYEKKDKYDISKHKWFFVYHKEKNLFVIEGWDIEYIKNISLEEPGIKRDYSIVVEIVNDNILYKHLYYNGDKDLLVLHQKNEREYFFSQRKFKRENSDYTVQIERHRIKHGYKIIYKFVAGKLIKSIKDFQARNIEMRLYLRSNSFSKPLDVSGIKDLELYNGKVKVVSELENRMKIMLGGEKNDSGETTGKKILHSYKKNELFVLNFLELSIADFWHNNKSNDFYKNNREKVFSEIAKIKYNTTYVERKIYLYNVIDVLFQEYANLVPKDQKMSDLYEKIVSFIETCDTLKFEENIPIGFTINTNSIDEKIENLLSCYDYIIYTSNNGDWPNSIGNFLLCEMTDMSSGEFSLINGLAGILYAIDINKSNKFEKYILVLDEPDENLHPEWSRRYLLYLSEMINADKDIKKVDIFISSHSPFMATDFFKERILKIKVDGSKRITENADFGILSNIGSIIKSDFFLEYPFGEYAKVKLFEYRDLIKRGNLTDSEIEDLEQYIFSIGDPYIQSTLREELTRKIGKRKISKQEILGKIEYYQEELKRIEEGK